MCYMACCQRGYTCCKRSYMACCQRGYTCCKRGYMCCWYMKCFKVVMLDLAKVEEVRCCNSIG